MHANDQDSSRNTLNANGSAELWQKQLFLDGTASITQQVANTQAPTSQSTANAGVNSLETRSWTLGPRFLHHFGTWAETTSILSHNAISTKRPGSGNSINGATSGTVTGASAIGDSAVDTSSFVMNSGRRFTQVLWSVSAHDIKTSSESAPHHDDKLGRADLTYVVNRQLSLTGGGGLQIINDATLTNSPSGPIWTVGATYRPGPRLSLQVSYNNQYDEKFFLYSGTYSISPRTQLTFSHTETITTTPQLLSQRQPVFDPLTGTFVDPLTGLPLDPNVAPTGLDNNTRLQKVWNATFSSSSGRNHYSLNLNRTSSTVELTGQVTTQTGVAVSFSRALTHLVNGAVSANYNITHSNGAAGGAAGTLPGFAATTAAGRSTNLLLTGTLGYTLTKETTLNFTATYSAFDGGDPTLSTHEKAAALSLRRTF
jgi:uncharacterized protein (PEP-CTERM system associated)